MENVLKAYLRRLNNLSGNNRSLQLLRILKEQFIDIHDFNFINNEQSFDIIKKLIGKKNSIYLCNELDSRDYINNNLGKRLRRLKRTDKFIFEERGAKDLYVGWPFIKGKFSDGTITRCPLVFFPVSIAINDSKWTLQRRPDVNITLNKTFLLAYYYYNQIEVDEELVETIIEGYEKDSIVFRTQLYELLKKANIDIQFNSDNFGDQLEPFKDFNKAQLESVEKNGVIKMYPEAVLGIFPQAGSYLVPDYLKIIEENKDPDLESFFERKSISPNDRSINDRVIEENTFTPFPIDAYQEQALKQIKSGSSIVVQGPPGTGKSQLIANTICDFIARGKSVLLVCQKKAALDVVYERLKKKDLNEFTALVHDFKNDRKPIFDQIDFQISSIQHYQQKNNGLDTIQLERNYLKSSRRIDQIEEELEYFRKALFDENECGKSVKELYLTSSLDKPRIDLNLEYKRYSYSDLERKTDRLKKSLAFYTRFEQKNHFWNSGPSFANFQTKDLIRIEEVISEIPEFVDTMLKESSFSFRKIDFETIEHFSQRIPLIEHLRKGLSDTVVFKIYKQLHKDKPNKELPWLTQVEKTMMSCFRGAGIESSIKTEDLGRFQEVLESAINARKSPLSWIKWSVFSHEKTLLKRVMVANNLKQTKEDFDHLVEKIDNRLNFEDAISQVLDNPWLHNFPYSFRKIAIQDWFYWQKRGLNMYYVSLNTRTINEYFPVSQIEHKDYTDKLGKLLKLLKKVPLKIEEWSLHLSQIQVRSIVYKKVDLPGIKNSLRKDFDAICEYHKLRQSFTKEENSVLNKLIDLAKSKDEAIDVFTNSLALAWIDHIESKYPELRIVSSGKMNELIHELREEVETKRQLSKQIVLLKIREKTYEDVAYNRLNNRVTYRDLQHQVTKKRRVWPIRKVVAEYSEELFSLIPCWMCSPESASAIFPMKEQFDLIIFDEASQCFVERGIPSMYRGKQVVIAGDSQQLQPSDLYRIRWENEEDTLDLNIDSLLDLAKQYLPETNLNGHYRSKSLSLIDFSNQHFYKGNLSILPDKEYINRPDPAIAYHKVDGVWENNTNPIEAIKVSYLVLNLLENQDPREIGIVTFNYHQQELILDTLEAKSKETGLVIPETLFVKNIENVQGDEKDIIIFSIGYAPDKEGALRLQFGSLNISGGENRLNVAITRAREKILIVSSLLPKDLQVENTKNEGPKMLKKYLEHAWQVSQRNWSPTHKAEKEHNTDWFLQKKIEDPLFHASEATISAYLPFADLTVRTKNKFNGVIATDDNHFFNAISAKQIYVYQHYLLAIKNWTNDRIYSREYWLNQEETRDRIRKFIFSVS